MRWRIYALAGAALVVAGCSTGAGSAGIAGTTGATGTTGTVAGTYVRVGGPTGMPSVPLSGTISFRGRGGSAVSFTADSTGKFTGRLLAGTYTVTAKSRLVNSGTAPCARPLTTQVQAGKTATLTIYCDIR